MTRPDVIAAHAPVPRHRFVPEDLVDAAYDDHPLPIGDGQTISQPYIVALMTEALELKPSDRVLEIGTGSGYQAAVLSALKAQVYTIEIKPRLYEAAVDGPESDRSLRRGLPSGRRLPGVAGGRTLRRQS